MPTLISVGPYILDVCGCCSQIWPDLPSSKSSSHQWQGPPLLSPKVVCLMQLLHTKATEASPGAGGTAPGASSSGSSGGNGASDDWWSGIVFVETKVGKLVFNMLMFFGLLNF